VDDQTQKRRAENAKGTIRDSRGLFSGGDAPSPSKLGCPASHFLKFTRYYHEMRKRPDRAFIRQEWVQQAVDHPIRQVIQQDGRLRRWEDTDTLYIEFKAAAVAETRDLDENTLLDLDADGNITGMTIEHASTRTEVPTFSYETVAA
jgi:uncharacterized protein YuzE